MNSIDRHYEGKYRLPLCPSCGQDTLTYNTYKVYKVELFCDNELCPEFVRTFWVDKSNLEQK